jgi:S-sulfo-L-cysteine synthase (O-acetyl-L-serine-dependent)
VTGLGRRLKEHDSQRLARAGFFVGQSSGAYMVGLERMARRERAGRFVTLFNDLGERYFSTRLWD